MKQISIIWSVVDVIELAKKMNVVITMYEAEKILYNVERHHDANIGINWLVIESHIDEFIQERSQSVINSKSWFKYLAK